STVSTSSRFRSGSTTAASSPIPTVSHPGGGGKCGVSRPTSSASVTSATRTAVTLLCVINRPRFTNDGDLDLAGVLQFVLDPARDVLREPDRFFVGDLLALDHDADLAAGLEGEGLRDALERIGDALELLEPLHVRLE